MALCAWRMARGMAARRIPLLLPSARCLAGKAMRDRSIEKKAPWPYENWEFNMGWSWIDKTTLRFDENTKILIVDGAHGVGKTKFAKELAEELEMRYVPQPSMDYFYMSPYGHFHLRELNDVLLPRLRTYDEKDFARDPTGPVPGSYDRMLFSLFQVKFDQYWKALRHLFNTGQGVVLEGSPFSHYAYVDAAYNAGWISKYSKQHMEEAFKFTLYTLLRPNLIIYLDAPVDVIQKKVKERGNEWDKDSPVWTNTSYLKDFYNIMKKDYLKRAQPHTEVLSYDWSEPGETDIVIEDIEKVNLDYFGQFEAPQQDWRLFNDEIASQKRAFYSSSTEYHRLRFGMTQVSQVYDATHYWMEPQELENMRDAAQFIPGHRFAYGFNKDMGDPEPLWHIRGTTKAWFNDYFFSWAVRRAPLRFWDKKPLQFMADEYRKKRLEAKQ